MVRLIILRLTESFFRNRGLYQLPVVLMIVLAGLYVLFAPRVYVSSGTLYVQEGSLLSSLAGSGGGGSWWITPAQAAVSEFNELMGTDAFVRSVVHKTALEATITSDPSLTDEAIWEVRQSVSFSAVGDNLIRFSGTFGDPIIAQQIAQATIDTYLQWKLNTDQRESVVAQEFFAKQIEPFQQELAQAQTELRAFLEAHPEPVRGNRPTDEALALDQLRGRVSQAIDRIENARTRSDDARLAQSIAESEVYQKYRVVDAPQLPVKPTLGIRGVLMNIVIFVAVGVFLSVIGIAGGAVLDRSLRFPLDVRHSLSLPVLAMMPDTRQAAISWFPWLARKARQPALRPLIAPPAQPAEPREPCPDTDGRPLSLEDLMRSFQSQEADGVRVDDHVPAKSSMATGSEPVVSLGAQ